RCHCQLRQIRAARKLALCGGFSWRSQRAFRLRVYILEPAGYVLHSTTFECLIDELIKCLVGAVQVVVIHTPDTMTKELCFIILVSPNRSFIERNDRVMNRLAPVP